MCYINCQVRLHCYEVKFFDFPTAKNAKKEGMVTYANH